MIVLNGKTFDYPKSINWLDDPHLCPKATDFSIRETWIRSITVHTVHGKKGPLLPGGKDTGEDFAYAKYFATTARKVSSDYIIDCDGSIAATNDPVKFYTWHAENVNGGSLGIEFVQDEKTGALYEDQIAAGVKFIHFLCDEIGIQKQTPIHNKNPDADVLIRLLTPLTGHDVIGVYGHRNVTHQRGFGDPGNWIFEALLKSGFEGFDFRSSEDLAVWTERQTTLGFSKKDIDGIAGPFTKKSLEAKGYKRGIWVNRL